VAWRGVAWRGVAWRGVAWRGVASSRSGVTNANENICFQKRTTKRKIKEKHLNAITYTAVLCVFLGCRFTSGRENKKLI